MQIWIAKVESEHARVSRRNLFCALHKAWLHPLSNWNNILHFHQVLISYLSAITVFVILLQITTEAPSFALSLKLSTSSFWKLLVRPVFISQKVTGSTAFLSRSVDTRRDKTGLLLFGQLLMLLMRWTKHEKHVSIAVSTTDYIF